MALCEGIEPGDGLIEGVEVRLVARHRLRASCMRILLVSSHMQAFAGVGRQPAISGGRGSPAPGLSAVARKKAQAVRSSCLNGRLLALLAQPMGTLIATRSSTIL